MGPLILRKHMSLKDLLVEEKNIEIEYPGAEGFNVTLTFLGKDALTKIRNKATITKINKKTRTPEEELDTELFTKVYISAVLKGWSGFKYKYVGELIPADLSSVDEEDELEYSEENARLLMKHSSEFDTWVAEIVGDLQNFTKTK